MGDFEIGLVRKERNIWGRGGGVRLVRFSFVA